MKDGQFSSRSLWIVGLVGVLLGGVGMSFLGDLMRGRSGTQQVEPDPDKHLKVAADLTVLPEERAEEKPAVSERSLATLIASAANPNHEDVEAFLNDRGRDAESLACLFQLTGDVALIREALERFPEDPLVLFTAVASDKLALAERRELSGHLVEHDPDNALAYGLAATLWAEEAPDVAAQLVVDAVRAGGFENHAKEMFLNLTAFSSSLGFSSEEAPIAGHMQQLQNALLQPNTMQRLMKVMSSHGADLYDAGDREAADRVVASGLAFSQRYGEESGNLMSTLVSQSMEAILLAKLEPSGEYAFLEHTPEAYRTALKEESKQQRSLLKSSLLAEQWMNLPFEISGTVLREYSHRSMLLGESEALRWLSEQSLPEKP